MNINPREHEILVDEAEEIKSLAYTLQAALESENPKEFFIGASCILSDKLMAFVERLKAQKRNARKERQQRIITHKAKSGTEKNGSIFYIQRQPSLQYSRLL